MLLQNTSLTVSFNDIILSENNSFCNSHYRKENCYVAFILKIQGQSSKFIQMGFHKLLKILFCYEHMCCSSVFTKPCKGVYNHFFVYSDHTYPAKCTL